MSPAITLSTIAKECGVSIATVSLALRDEPSVGASTAKQVREVAARLGYRPNLAARSLSQRRKSWDLEQLSGSPICIPFNQSSIPRHSDPLFFDFFCGLADELGCGPNRLEISRFSKTSEEFDVVKTLVQNQQIAGIVDFGLNKPTLEYLLTANFPVVTPEWRDSKLGIPAILADHVGGYRQAWKYALELQHQRVGFFGIEPPESNVHFAECRAAAAMEGLPDGICRGVFAANLDSRDDVWKSLVKAFGPYHASRWPTLFFTRNDFIAARFIGVLRENGLRVPEQVSVIGFDDSGAAICSNPLITTLRVPRHDIGREMAVLLREIIAGKAKMRNFVQTMPVDLVIRESTAPANSETIPRRAQRPLPSGKI